MVASLRSALQVTLQQNSELRSRLQKIRAETEAVVNETGPNLTTMSLDLDLAAASHRLGHHSLSYSSSCVSQSEFFDAKEYLTDVGISDSSSDASETELEGENEAEEEGSVSEASEIGNDATHMGDTGAVYFRLFPHWIQRFLCLMICGLLRSFQSKCSHFFLYFLANCPVIYW